MVCIIVQYYEKKIDKLLKIETLELTEKEEFNSFEEIPNYDDVILMSCDDNKLTQLPPLPKSLKKLYCRWNLLTSLPELPKSLTIIFCNQNQLTSLPELHKGLESLCCSDNQLTSLPKLPSSLEDLYCSNNQLTSLPKLPGSLDYLSCSGNRLKYIPLSTRNIRYLTHLYCQDNDFIKKQEDYLQKIIYCLTPNLKVFIKNLFDEFSQECLECGQVFLNIEKYKFIKWRARNGGRHITELTIIKNHCRKCLGILANYHY